MAPLVQAEGVAKHFAWNDRGGASGVLRAVDGVDIAVDAGETLGSSASPAAGSPRYAGCSSASSTTAGRVLFDGQDLGTLKGDRLKRPGATCRSCSRTRTARWTRG